MKKGFVAGTVLGLGAALLSACGGGGSASSSTSSAVASGAAAVPTPTPSPAPAAAPSPSPSPAPTPSPAPSASPAFTDTFQTISANGSIDHGNPFFRAGANGRSCATCHQEDQGWSITPANIRARFDATDGADPLFRMVDGANSLAAPTATTTDRRTAYSMLLDRGVFRISMTVPANAEFEVVSVNDPHGQASKTELSLFRRPLPSTNLKFVNTVMWDGRETLADAVSGTCIAGSQPAQCFASSDINYGHQANTAFKLHGETSADLSDADRKAIVDFETALFTAKSVDAKAGSLDDGQARGGPTALAAVPFYFGINDVFAGDYRTGARFNEILMTLYDAWNTATPGAGVSTGMADARRAIARGQALFNAKPFLISDVPGFNDRLRSPTFLGTCASCHTTPDIGSQSTPTFIRLTTGSDAALSLSGLPTYALKNKTTGELLQTTDPGRAMISGKWADVGTFKVPNLRGLDARAPYFHDGSAKTLDDLMVFYNLRFSIGLSNTELADLKAFLKSL